MLFVYRFFVFCVCVLAGGERKREREIGKEREREMERYRERERGKGKGKGGERGKKENWVPRRGRGCAARRNRRPLEMQGIASKAASVCWNY